MHNNGQLNVKMVLLSGIIYILNSELVLSRSKFRHSTELTLRNKAPTQQLFTCLHRRTKSGAESLLTKGNESNVIEMSSKSFFQEDDAAQANKFAQKAKDSPFMLIGKSRSQRVNANV